MNLEYRHARRSDLETLVEMLANDQLGSQREDPSRPLNQRYLDAFQQIDADPNNQLIVAEHEGEIAGMLQLTFIPYLTHTGSWRCLIEGVRIAESFRNKGLGTDLIHWAIETARDRRCSLVQLTSDKQRPNAIRFYESLGFKATHEGFKLKL